MIMIKKKPDVEGFINRNQDARHEDSLPVNQQIKNNQETSKTASRKKVNNPHNSNSARQDKDNTSKPAKQEKDKKVTFYIPPSLMKKFKIVSIEQDQTFSNLIVEAIKDVIKKYQ